MEANPLVPFTGCEDETAPSQDEWKPLRRETERVSSHDGVEMYGLLHEGQMGKTPS